MLVGQDRARTQIPPEGVLTVFLLEILVPEDLTLEIECGEVTALEIHKDVLAIRDWRGVTPTALLMLARLLVADFGLPEHFARLAVQAPDFVLAVLVIRISLGTGEHDERTGDDRR